LKILQVTGNLYPHSFGGIGVVVDSLSDNLVHAGIDVEVLSLDLVDNIRYKKPYLVTVIPYKFKIWGNPISLSALLWLIKRRYKYDIIHAHSHLFYSTLLCALLRRIGSSPLVITNHGLYSQTAQFRVNAIWLHTLGKFIYATADKVICLSEHDKKELVNLGIDESKIIVIPNWVNTRKFYPDPKRTIRNRVLFVGRLVPGKGVSFLIDAFIDINKKIPNAKLIVVGSGPEEAKIKQLIVDYSLNDVVELKKNLNEDELIEEYQKCSVFVLPSFCEGLPLTVLEAMACGKPVIATADIHDIVGKAGMIVHHGSPKELETAILSLLLNVNKMEEFSAQCRKSIELKHTWIKVKDIIISNYKELVK